MGLSFYNAEARTRHCGGEVTRCLRWCRGAQVRQLKEMVILPLLYPALMAHMHITPPRHVLFCLSLTDPLTKQKHTLPQFRCYLDVQCPRRVADAHQRTVHCSRASVE